MKIDENGMFAISIHNRIIIVVMTLYDMIAIKHLLLVCLKA